MIRASDLVSKFKYMINNKWGYIPGKAGQIWTKEQQEKTKVKIVQDYGSKWIGHHVADCSGAFAWAFKELGGFIFHGSNTMWRQYTTEKGTIGSNIIVPGTAVWKGRPDKKYDDGIDYYHVGLYVGDGKVIEAKGTAYGVVTSKLSEWQYWGLLKDVEYSTKPETDDFAPGKYLVDVPNDGTLRVRSAPKSNSSVICQVREGDALYVTENDGTWAKVEILTEGYVMSKFIREAN